MKLKNYYMPTLREVPAEAGDKSQALLLRAAMIRRVDGGLFASLPLGQRVMHKLEQAVREKMEATGGNEMQLPVLSSEERREQAGLPQDPNAFRLKDRTGKEYTLTRAQAADAIELIKGEISSYKQLPMTLYQMQTGSADIQKPHLGLNDARNANMLSAYTFSGGDVDAKAGFTALHTLFTELLDELGVPYETLRATDLEQEPGEIALMAISERGDHNFVSCPSCHYSAPLERAGVRYVPEKVPAADTPSDVHTPGATTIADLSEFLDIPPSHCAKAVDLLVDGKPVFLFVPGDRELNMAKAAAYLGTTEEELEMMDPYTVRDLTGSEPGYTGPVGLDKRARIIVDRSLTDAGGLVVGANRTEYHKTDVVFGRDFEGEVADDLLMIEETDVCPDCGGALSFDRGFKIAEIRQLGTDAAKAMNATFLDENGKAVPFALVTASLDLSAVLSTVAGARQDDKGLTLPVALAPFPVIVTIANLKDETSVKEAEALYARLKEDGVDVCLDDRNVRAGVKFNDRDLIGFPVRVTVGKKAGEGIVEYSLRADGENEEISFEEAEERIRSQNR